MKVPTDLKRNLEFRHALRNRARGDKGLQRDLIERCLEDTCFWVEAFVWLYEPRMGEGMRSGKIPWILWPKQREAFAVLDQVWGKEDIGAEKARGEGASWMASSRCTKDFALSRQPVAFGLVSRTEDAVDNPNDPDSLLWKVQFILDTLPEWMVPPYKRTLNDHTFLNQKTKSTIIGYSAVGDVGSGGRKTVFVMDELAKFPRGPDQEAMDSTGPVTNCRFIISTPKGNDGVYAEIMNRDPEELEMRKLVLDWKENPTRNVGLYRCEGGALVPIDADYWRDKSATDYQETIWRKLKAHGYKMSDTVRSPWYDKQCLRPGSTPKSIAQEYDRSYGGSDDPFFDAELIKEARHDTQKPWIRGVLEYDSFGRPMGFHPKEHGELLLWTHIDRKGRGRPPTDREFSAGVDISAGTAGSQSSFSVICVIDKRTKEQVAEMAINTMVPEEWALQCAAICRWFGGTETEAFMIPENNGPVGVQFMQKLDEIGFGNIYVREMKGRVNRGRTKELGWRSKPGDKSELLGPLRDAMGTLDPNKRVVLRSERLVKELGRYKYRLGKVVHTGAMNKEEQAEVGENHGDRAIAAALAMHGLEYVSPEEEEDKELSKEPAVGTFEHHVWSYFNPVAKNEFGYLD